MRPFSARWRHQHARTLRVAGSTTAALALAAGLTTAAVAAASSGSGGGWGDAQVGTQNAQGVLLASNQRVKPAGTRLLITNGRMPSSAISPNGQYLAALSWYDFTGFLTIVDLKTNKVVTQVGATGGMGDGSVAADGPLWSADGTTLWVPQTSDMLRFTVGSDGSISGTPVKIPLQEVKGNLNGGTTVVPDLPSGMALSSDGKLLYVALNGVNELGVIDTTTNTLVRSIHVGNAPRQVVLAGGQAFVSNEGGRPAKPGDFTNLSDGTAIVSDKVTGAASTGTVSVVNLATGREASEISVGLEPTAEYLTADGTLIVGNSNNDSLSLINTKTGAVEQTVNVNPLPGATVGSYPNSITMPDATHVLVSIGRDNAIAEYGYSGAKHALSYQGLIPTDQYPVAVAYDSALGKVVVTNDKGVGSLGPQSTIDKGPDTYPAPEKVTGHNTYDDTSSITQFTMPTSAQLGAYTHQVFVDNDWEHLLASGVSGASCGKTVSAIPAVLGCGSPIKHVFLIVRENRTYDQVFGDIGKGNSDPSLAQFGSKITPNAHKIASTFPLFDNFYDEGTLSADGHNWLTQADANDYIEKEFGAFYRSYPAQGGDALAYQRNGFLWNAAAAAGKTVQDFGEYNNYVNMDAPTATWADYYKDSQILEGKASGPLPVPTSSIYTYSDIPSLNAIDYHQFPPFNLGIPDQYRTDIWLQSFKQAEKTGNLANLNMMWVMDDHTSGVGSGTPYPVAQVADNDLAVGRIIDAISHSKFWKSSAIFVVEDDTQNGADHVDGHRGPLMVVSPYAKRGVTINTYYSQLNVVRTIEQILGVQPMNQEDRAAEPMTDAFTNTPNYAPYTYVPNQIPLTLGLTSAKASPAATAMAAKVPASMRSLYEQWVVWSRDGRFTGRLAIADFANPAQLNRLDWYTAHNWKVPYPGDKAILAPNEVPGANLPSGYLGQDG